MLVLVIDWDETATVKDTTSLVAEMAYLRKRPTAAAVSFTHYVDLYAVELARYARTAPNRTSLASELEYQEGIAEVETYSILAIENDGIFRGLTPADLVAPASEVVLRQPFLEFVSELRDTPLCILSVNWCRSLIKEVLDINEISAAGVYANDLEVVDGITTGYIVGGIHSGIDKARKLREIRAQYPDKRLVYIGDSGTDIISIYEADVGIMLRGGLGVDTLRRIANVERLPSLVSFAPGEYVASWEEVSKVWFS